jgi:hypothetical protein
MDGFNESQIREVKEIAREVMLAETAELKTMLREFNQTLKSDVGNLSELMRAVDRNTQTLHGPQGNNGLVGDVKKVKEKVNSVATYMLWLLGTFLVGVGIIIITILIDK